jgi:hypothetical protein
MVFAMAANFGPQLEVRLEKGIKHANKAFFEKKPPEKKFPRGGIAIF